jgi:hypothetical protein
MMGPSTWGGPIGPERREISVEPLTESSPAARAGADRVSDLVVGDLRGYRRWKVFDNGYLASTFMSYAWGSATEVAACILADPAWDHPSPVTDCTCGLYAHYRATTVEPPWRRPIVPPVVGQPLGVVTVAGRVILGTRGMRAERMTLHALVTDDAALGERYGVPIYRSRKALLYDYPPPDYGDLVDVDPIDPPPYAAGYRAEAVIGVNPSGVVAGMRDAAKRLRGRLWPGLG